MSEKTLRLSLYCLGAVVALYLLVFLARGRSGPGAPDGGLAEALGGLDGAALVQIDIQGPGDTIRLERDGTAWRANGFGADTGSVQRLLRAIDDVAVSSVVATNPDNHARMGVDADSAWTLTAGDVSVLLGKAGNRYRTSYARMPGANSVGLLDGDLRAAAARSLFDWRDKIIVSADTAMIASVRIQHANTSLLYERQDSIWMVGGEEADASTMRGILQELARLRASGFAGDDVMRPLEADRSVRASDAAGTDIVSLTLQEREGGFWVTTVGSEIVFEIPTFRGDRVAPAPED